MKNSPPAATAPDEPLEIPCCNTSEDELRQAWRNLSLFSLRAWWRLLLPAFIVVVLTAFCVQHWLVPALELLGVALFIALAEWKMLETLYMAAIQRSGIMGATGLRLDAEGKLTLSHACGSTSLYPRRAFDSVSEHGAGLVLWQGKHPRLFLPAACFGPELSDLRERLMAVPARPQEPAEPEETPEGSLVYNGPLPMDANERTLMPLSRGSLWCLLALIALNAAIFVLCVLFLREPGAVCFVVVVLLSLFLPAILQPGMPNNELLTVRCRYGEEGLMASYSCGKELWVPYSAPLRMFCAKPCSFLLLPSQEQVPFRSMPPQLPAFPVTKLRSSKLLKNCLCLGSALLFLVLILVMPLLLVFILHALGLEGILPALRG